MMILLWLIFGSISIFASVIIENTAFKQDDYTVKLLIFHITRYNRSYSNDAKCDMQWFNRTTRVINCNGNLLRDLSNKIRTDAQIYKFSSNEYRLFPIQLSHNNLCNELTEDHFGIIESLRKSVNAKIACPFKKGRYSVKNAMIDFSKFPPHAPRGQYMDQVIFWDDNSFLGEVQVEAVIESVMRKWEN